MQGMIIKQALFMLGSAWHVSTNQRQSWLGMAETELKKLCLPSLFGIITTSTKLFLVFSLSK